MHKADKTEIIAEILDLLIVCKDEDVHRLILQKMLREDDSGRSAFSYIVSKEGMVSAFKAFAFAKIEDCDVEDFSSSNTVLISEMQKILQQNLAGLFSTREGQEGCDLAIMGAAKPSPDDADEM